MTDFLRTRDLLALAVASLATLALARSPDSEIVPTTDTLDGSSQASALAGLLDRRAAAVEGSWWLDTTGVATRLSFAAEHHRLVWWVEGRGDSVVLDAETGELLAFGFE